MFAEISPVVQSLAGVFRLIVPEGLLVLGACVLFLGATFWKSRNVSGWVALLSLAAALAAVFGTLSWTQNATPDKFAASLYFDPMALLIKVVAIVGGAVLVLFSWDEVPDRLSAEYHACVLVIVAGLSLTGSANELVTLFVALELISIPTYIILYLPRYDEGSQEAALKYFLLSIFSSALLLFGFSYLYGLSGTTNLPATFEALATAGSAGLPGAAQIALVMIVAGLCFRITAVPFHFYAPDVYQGAPTGAVALLAFMPKVAGFVALIRVLGYVWAGTAGDGPALGPQVPILMWILAAVTMTLGNILALLQRNIKRLLAYSSVAHAGYMLIGLTVAPALSRAGSAVPGGVDAVLFYLVAYGAMTIGAFAVLEYLSTPQRRIETEDDLAGLSRSHPGVALLTALFLFSLIGIPLTAGFAGKLMLFLGAMGIDPEFSSNYRLFRILALIGVLNSAVGAWYYLRILARMYLHNPVKPLPAQPVRPTLAAIWACAAVTLVFGVYPWPLVQEMHKAARPEGPAQVSVRVNTNSPAVEPHVARNP